MPDVPLGSWRWWVRGLAAPADPDARALSGARGLALLALVVLAPLIVWESDAAGWLRAAGLLGLAWLGWWWSAERAGRPLAATGELIGAGWLFTAAVAVGHPELALGVIYAGCCLRALRGNPRTVAALVGLYIAAYLGAVVVSRGVGASGLTPAAVTAVVPGLLLAAALAQRLGVELGRRRRAVRIDGALRAAAGAIGAVATQGSVIAAAGLGADALRAAGPAAAVALLTDPARLAERAGPRVPGRGSPRPIPVPPSAPPALRQRLRRGGTVATGDPAWSALARMLALDSASRHVLLVPVADEGDPWATFAVASAVPLPADLAAGWRALAADCALALERARAAETLAQGEARFRSFVEAASDLVVAINAEGRPIYLSPSVPEFLGRPVDLADPPDWQPLVHPDDVAALRASVGSAYRGSGPGLPVDCRLLARDGGWRWFDIVPTNLLQDPSAGAMVLTLRDISDRVALEDQLRHDALHDPLTGLANRALLRDRLEHALAARERTQRALVLLLLDLDHFKDVNDTFGHEAGDLVLLETTRRIRRCLRSSDTCARLGGDEFAILIEDAAGPETGPVLAARILEALRRPIRLSEAIRVTTAASVGITASVGGPVDARGLLQECDLALYTAKAEGRGRYVMYRAALQAGAEPRVRTRAGLAELPLASAGSG